MTNVVQFACECERENCKAPKHEFQRCSATAMISPLPGSRRAHPFGMDAVDRATRCAGLFRRVPRQPSRAEHAKTTG